MHRPRYDDWSLPKGKLDGGEHPLAAAVREVLEETGVRGEPQLRLPEVAYTLPDGVPKTVRVLADAGRRRTGPVPWTPTEVDERGLAAAAARPSARLSYPDERAAARAGRRAAAGHRGDRAGPARARRRAQGVVAATTRCARSTSVGRAAGRPARRGAAPVEPRRLFAATPLRCRQTLEPLADRAGRPADRARTARSPSRPTPTDVPGQGEAGRGPAGSSCATAGRAVICSQGKVMPTLLATLHGEDDPAAVQDAEGHRLDAHLVRRPAAGRVAGSEPAPAPVPARGSARQKPTRSPVSHRARHSSSARGSQSPIAAAAPPASDSTQVRYQP